MRDMSPEAKDWIKWVISVCTLIMTPLKDMAHTKNTFIDLPAWENKGFSNSAKRKSGEGENSQKKTLIVFFQKEQTRNDPKKTSERKKKVTQNKSLKIEKRGS